MLLWMWSPLLKPARFALRSEKRAKVVRDLFMMYIAHAERGWKAEEVNAARYQTQVQVLSAIGSAILVACLAGLIQILNAAVFMDMLRRADRWFWALMAFGVLILLLSFGLVTIGLAMLYMRSERVNRETPPATAGSADQLEPEPTSSHEMYLDEGTLVLIEGLERLDPAAGLAFDHIYRAFLDLADRNGQKRTAIAAARERILRGLRLSILAFALYGIAVVMWGLLGKETERGKAPVLQDQSARLPEDQVDRVRGTGPNQPGRPGGDLRSDSQRNQALAPRQQDVLGPNATPGPTAGQPAPQKNGHHRDLPQERSLLAPAAAPTQIPEPAPMPNFVGPPWP